MLVGDLVCHAHQSLAVVDEEDRSVGVSHHLVAEYPDRGKVEAGVISVDCRLATAGVAMDTSTSRCSRQKAGGSSAVVLHLAAHAVAAWAGSVIIMALDEKNSQI